MGRLKFAPYIFGVAAAFVFAANPADVQAVPVTTANTEISFGDLDIQGKIIYTATEEVASPFYKKGKLVRFHNRGEFRYQVCKNSAKLPDVYQLQNEIQKSFR